MSQSLDLLDLSIAARLAEARDYAERALAIREPYRGRDRWRLWSFKDAMGYKPCSVYALARRSSRKTGIWRAGFLLILPIGRKYGDCLRKGLFALIASQQSGC